MLLLQLCDVNGISHVLWKFPVLLVLPRVASTAAIQLDIWFFILVIRVKFSFMVFVNPRVIFSIEVRKKRFLDKRVVQNWARWNRINFCSLIFGTFRVIFKVIFIQDLLKMILHFKPLLVSLSKALSKFQCNLFFYLLWVDENHSEWIIFAHHAELLWELWSWTPFVRWLWHTDVSKLINNKK